MFFYGSVCVLILIKYCLYKEQYYLLEDRKNETMGKRYPQSYHYANIDLIQRNFALARVVGRPRPAGGFWARQFRGNYRNCGKLFSSAA